MKKVLPWILFGLASVAALYSFMLLMDASLALEDSRSRNAQLRGRCQLALTILRKDWIGREVIGVSDLSNELKHNGVIVSAVDNSYTIGDIIFETRGGVVSGVRYFD